jgi:integrase
MEMREKRKRGTGSIVTKAGTDYLYIRYYAEQNGKRVQKEEATGTKDPNVAEKILRERLVDTDRGAGAPAGVNRLKYEDIRDAYLQANPSQNDYHGLKYLNDFFKGMKTSRIETGTIRAFIERRRKDGVADPTIRRNLVALRAMFNQARKDGKLGHRDVPHFPMPEDSEAAGTYIEPAQYAAIRDALPENLRPFFNFMYGTGCRLGAMQKITWGMVSGDNRDVINLPASIIKTKKPLMIVLDGPMLSPIAETLQKLFRREDSKIIFDSTNYRTAWSKACAKAGIGTFDPETRRRTGVRIHDCRCSAAINLLDAGVDEGTVLKIGGWKTRAMLDRYNVQNEKRIRKAMQTGGEYVKAQMGEKA